MYASIHNRFDVVVVDAVTGRERTKATAYNTICNGLWSRMLSNNSYFTHIHYGTGQGTPSSADSSLFTFLGAAEASLSTHQMDYTKGVYFMRKWIQLQETQHVGAELTEVGIGYSTSASSLCTHAMLQDMNGNPISIVKGDTDIINIYATVYVHFNPAGYDNGSIHIFGPTKDSRNTYYGVFGMLVGHNDRCVFPCSIEGSRYHNAHTGATGNGGTRTFSVADRTVTLTGTRMAAGKYNVGGLTELFFSAELWYSGTGLSWSGTNKSFIIALVGGEWFPYSEVVGEAVGTGDGESTEFSLDFPYAHDVEVYIDGVALDAEEFTVLYSPNGTTVAQTVLWLNPESMSVGEVPSWSANAAPAVFKNPAYKDYGLATVYGANASAEVYASNDLKEWVSIGAGTSIAVPIEYQHYKYWRSTSTFGGNIGVFNNTNANALHFNSAPAAGAVVVANYKCDCIAKDANHVFDFTMTIHLNEHSEAQ